LEVHTFLTFWRFQLNNPSNFKLYPLIGANLREYFLREYSRGLADKKVEGFIFCNSPLLFYIILIEKSTRILALMSLFFFLGNRLKPILLFDC